MRLLMKFCMYFSVLNCLLTTTVFAEPYRLIAGSTEIGFRENDKQNVNLGFNSVFNELLISDNIKCDFKSYDNSEALVAAIQKKQVNAFFGSPIEFLQAESHLLSDPIVSGLFNNKLKYKILLLVRSDSRIKQLSQLKSKKLATQKWISGDVGGLFLENLLLENKLGLPKSFFSEIQNVETSNRALVDLFFKKADAVLVTENQFEIAAELNPQLRSQTQVLAISEPYLIFVAALIKNTPEHAVAGVRSTLLTVHKTPKGKKILNLLNLQGFQEIVLDDFENVRALVAKNNRLKAQQDVY